MTLGPPFDEPEEVRDAPASGRALRRRPPNRPRNRPTPIVDTLREILSQTPGEPRRRRSSAALRVFEAFAQLGPPFTTHAEPVFYRNGVLTLQIEHSGWLTELTFLAAEIIAGLNTRLGAETVKELRTRHGPLSARPAPKRVERAPPPALTSGQVRRVAELAEGIRDPVLREAFARAATWTIAKTPTDDD